jgi:proline racemase
MTRQQLLARYRELVLGELPRRARTEGWVVTADHCFGRIVLDNVMGGRWYDVLDRRRSPAFAQLTDEQLAAAVALAERVAQAGDPLLRELDARSLAWRGKPAKRDHAAGRQMEVDERGRTARGPRHRRLA